MRLSGRYERGLSAAGRNGAQDLLGPFSGTLAGSSSMPRMTDSPRMICSYRRRSPETRLREMEPVDLPRWVGR